jgi:hypothetical protein
MSEPHPDQTLPGDLPDEELPDEPGDLEDLEVMPPIVLPPEATDQGDLQFAERKALNLIWDADAIGEPWRKETQTGEIVGICVLDPASNQWKLVKKVKNTGGGAVTFPSSFTGEREFKVVGSEGNQGGTYSFS